VHPGRRPGREGLRRRRLACRSLPRNSRSTGALGALLGGLLIAAGAARAQSLEELRQLSLEDLANIEITSVSKRPESLSQAAAAVYVITREDIRASGATSLPEALRLAPNLQVARISSQDYTISARGFNSANAADKLLVLIDGRSIYQPFFHNVVWDLNEVMLDDVERIEVISGPGGTLWGANAVNGVINVITRSSSDTQGGLANLKFGNFDQSGAVRWGGRVADNWTYRAYMMGFGRGDTDIAGSRTSTHDSWQGYQAGFRSDWTGGPDGLTVQGDIFENPLDIGGRANGGNFLGRWTRRLGDGSSLELQSYYDRSDEDPGGGALRDNTDTVDFQLQHSIPFASGHQLVWGVGQRVWRDTFFPTNGALILPPSQTLALTNLFAEDTIRLADSLRLTLGAKLEYNTFSGLEPMPSIRLAWQPTAANLVWAAISRAAETPSRLDRNLVISPIFGPSPQFQSEHVIAYETGYRAEFTKGLSASISLFYNDYSDVRTTSLVPGSPPIIFRNDLAGHTYGLESWADLRPVSWLRISAGVDLLHKALQVKAGGNDIAGIQTAAGIDPNYQVFLRSYLQLSDEIDAYVGLRQIGRLAPAGIPSYFEADARLGWHVSSALELFLAGYNLVHAHHIEATTGFGLTFSIPRSALVGLRRSF
jgi:iron complex outermembrane recepter protein